MSTLISFFGGSAFRMIWGEVSSYFTRKQDHRQELERIDLQERLDAAKHTRQKELLELQHHLGVEQIQIEGGLALDKAAADAFTEAVAATGHSTGVKWVDAWNASIRPGGATLALIMIVAEIIAAGFVIPSTTQEVLFAFLGIFVADRSLAKRSK